MINFKYNSVTEWWKCLFGSCSLISCKYFTVYLMEILSLLQWNNYNCQLNWMCVINTNLYERFCKKLHILIFSCDKRFANFLYRNYHFDETNVERKLKIFSFIKLGKTCDLSWIFQNKRIQRLNSFHLIFWGLIKTETRTPRNLTWP